MPLKVRHTLSVQLTCQRPGCDVLFHPWRGREATQVYCSTDCSRAAGVFMHAGTWPKLPARGTFTPTSESPPDTRSRSFAVRAEHVNSSSPWPEPYDSNRERAEWHEEGARLAQVTDRLERLAKTRRREGRTVTVGGHGAWLGVEHDALVCARGRTYGAPGEREVFHKALHDLAHVVLLGPDYTLTGPALAWCQAEGVGVSILDQNGALLAELILPPDRVREDVALRRRQYTLSAEEQTGLARAIVRCKVEGQRAMLMRHPELPDRHAFQRATEAFDMAERWLAFCDKHGATDFLSTLNGIQVFEARVARAYFDALAALPLRFAREDLTRGVIPPHWLTFGQRTSPRAPNGNARHAVRPGHALLNYGYGCLESQCRTALGSAGFDPACGVLHADKPNRESLVFDLMELERASVDNLVVRFMTSPTVHAADFAKATDGSVKLHPQLARTLVAACRVEQRRLDEHARWLRRVLLAVAEPTVAAQPAAVAAL